MDIKLKEVRKARGMSAKDVASHMNVSYSTYMRYENGQIQPNLMQLVDLCDILQCSADDIVGRDFSRQKSEPESTIEYYMLGLNDDGLAKLAEFAELVFMSPKYRTV